MAMLGVGACGESSPSPAAVKPASFGTPLAKTFAEGHQLATVGVGDVDGDGSLDVVANEANVLAVFRGDGRGGLANDPLDGSLTNSFNTAVADLTGDGRADVIASGVGTGNVRIFPGRADGTLGPSIAYGVPAQFITRFLVVDMTGDGALDVLLQAMTFDVAGGNRTFLAVLPNRGNGVLDEPLLTPLDVTPVAWTATDLNGDGTMDVAITDPITLTLQRMLNDGQGHLSAPQALVDDRNEAGAMFAGDFDGDGRPDLLETVASGEQLVIFRNAGGGTFQPQPPIELGCLATDVVTADLNKDGRTDVAAVVSTGALLILHAQGGTLVPAGAYATGGTTGLVRAGDFDNDGAVDLVVANGTVAGGNLGVLVNDGRGLFDAAPILPLLGEALTMSLSDVTGDGLADIVVSATGVENPSLATFQSSAEGTFRAAAMPVPVVGFPAGLAVGDLNGDHAPDIVMTSQSDGRPLVFPGRGSGQFGVPTTLDLGQGDKVALGDLDGDAFPDLALTSIDPIGDVQLFSGRGDGTFAPLQRYNAANGPVLALRIIDVTGDGRADVVSSLTSNDDGTGVISILASSGPRAFAAPSAVPLVPPLYAFVVADLDHDGRPDLTGSSMSGTEVPLLLGPPRGRPFTRESIDLGNPTAGVASADFNNDGWIDLAFADQVSGDVLVLANDHRGAFTQRLTIPLRAEAHELGAADLNGDGKVDLAVLTAAGVVVLWNTSP